MLIPFIITICRRRKEPLKKEVCVYRDPVFLPTKESKVIQDNLNKQHQILNFTVLEDQIGNLRVYGRKEKSQIVTEITYIQRELKNCIDFYAEQMEKTYENTVRICK